MAMSDARHNSSRKTNASGEPTMVRGDGVRLSCHASGDPTQPTIVFVHGYPDTHTVWDAVIAELESDFHCVRYDIRGAGNSSRPRRTSAYRLSHLRADLAAVIDWASPEAPVHLVGHDWGSIQSWEAVTDDTLAGRIASFTSISGPCLDHAGRWLRQRGQDKRTSTAKQLRKSWYIFAFHLPLLPALAWRSLMPRIWPQVTARTEGESLATSSTLARDGAYGVKLYRANVLPRLKNPRKRHARMPVQVITPEHDAFVGPEVVDGLEQWVDDLTVTPIDAPHWAVLTDPEEIAGYCGDFIHRKSGRTTAHSTPPGEPS